MVERVTKGLSWSRMNRKRAVIDAIARFPFGEWFLAQAGRAKTDLKSIRRSRIPYESLEGHWPKCMNVEVTNICNANCIFCAYQYQDRWRSGRGVMDEAIFQKAVDTHAKNEGRFVGLAPVVGEPLIDPNIINRVRYVIEHGMETSFFTNAILLNHLDLERFLKTGIKSISISTAPFDAGAFALIYRSKRYADVLSGLQKLLTLRNKLGVNFTISICFRSNLSYAKTLSLPDFRRAILPLLHAEELSLIGVTNRFDDWSGQIKQEDLLPGMRLKLSPSLKRRPCKWIFVPMVGWDGKVRACCCRFKPGQSREADELLVGDMSNAALTDIWFGEKVRQLRLRFVHGDPPIVCRDCPVYDPC